MQNRILIRTALLFLVTSYVALAIHNSDNTVEENKDTDSSHLLEAAVSRHKRAVSKKPGFFRTLFQVVVEQWNDTKNTISSVRKQLDDNFLPENAPVMETTTASSNPNASTTTMPYKIKRSELNRILQRNLRGIVRLFNLELQDALKQSDKNYDEFKRNASIEVSKYL